MGSSSPSMEHPSLLGNAGGSCQCFSQQMPPADLSLISGFVDSGRGVLASPQKISAGGHLARLRFVYMGVCALERGVEMFNGRISRPVPGTGTYAGR